MAKVYLDKETLFNDIENEGVKIPYSADVTSLSKEAYIKNKKVSNRILYQPMEGCDGNSDGTPGELTIRRYERFARGGAGIIWFEATAVMEEGKANPRQLSINEKNTDSFKALVEKIKEISLKENGFEPVIIMQATHSGRYSKPNGRIEPLIAINNPVLEGDNPIDKSRIVTDEYLDSVKEALVNGAVLAEKAGFDGVDIKCCHRYLNSELLSAYERKGRYGGDFEGRTRLLRESVKGAIDSAKKDFIVTSRLNVYDGYTYPYGFGVSKDGGTEFDPKEAILIIKELKKYGVDFLNITMGNPYFNPHVNRPFAKGPYTEPEHPLKGVERLLEGTKSLKNAVPEMLLTASGFSFIGTQAPNVAAGYIKDSYFDFAGFGREIFAYPSFAKDVTEKGCMAKDKICIACSMCSNLMRNGKTPGCAVRDEFYQDLYKKEMI